MSLNEKEISSETKELYRKNYAFMLKMVDFEKDTLEVVERVYNGYVKDREIKKLISQEHVSIKWSLFSTLFAILSIVYMVYKYPVEGFSVPLILLSIFLVLLASCFWNGYSKIQNRKGLVICRVVNNIIDQTKLSTEDKGCLQELISEKKMIDLLWGKEDISVRDALTELGEHIYPFRDYKAYQDLAYIKMMHNRDGNNSKTSGHKSSMIMG
ncbi:hypothetical protein ACTOJ1_000851 [Shigella flexneri]